MTTLLRNKVLLCPCRCDTHSCLASLGCQHPSSLQSMDVRCYGHGYQRICWWSCLPQGEHSRHKSGHQWCQSADQWFLNLRLLCHYHEPGHCQEGNSTTVLLTRQNSCSYCLCHFVSWSSCLDLLSNNIVKASFNGHNRLLWPYLNIVS